MTRKKLVPLKRGRKPLDPSEKLERKRKRDREYKRKKRQKEKEKAVAALLAAAGKPEDLLPYNDGEVVITPLIQDSNHSNSALDVLEHQQRLSQASFDSNAFFLQQQQLMANQLYQNKGISQSDCIPLMPPNMSTTTTTTTTTTTSTSSEMPLPVIPPDMQQQPNEIPAKKPRKPKKTKDNENQPEGEKKTKKKKKKSDDLLGSADDNSIPYEPLSPSALQNLLVNWGETTNQSSLVTQFLSIYQPNGVPSFLHREKRAHIPEMASVQQENIANPNGHNSDVKLEDDSVIRVLDPGFCTPQQNTSEEHAMMIAAHQNSISQHVPFPNSISGE